MPGITPFDQTTNLPLMLLPLHQKAIMGNLYGSISTYVDIPRLVNMAMNEDPKLDKLVTNKFKIEQNNDVADKMHKRPIRGRWVNMSLFPLPPQKRRRGGGGTPLVKG